MHREVSWPEIPQQPLHAERAFGGEQYEGQLPGDPPQEPQHAEIQVAVVPEAIDYRVGPVLHHLLEQRLSVGAGYQI